MCIYLPNYIITVFNDTGIGKQEENEMKYRKSKVLLVDSKTIYLDKKIKYSCSMSSNANSNNEKY